MFKKITRNEVIAFIKDYGRYTFGLFAEEVANLIVDEVVAEYNEAEDSDLMKAISYVIIDKFGGFDNEK